MGTRTISIRGISKLKLYKSMQDMSDRNFSKIQVVTDSLAFLILEQLAETGFFDSLEASPPSLFPAVVYVWDKQQLFGYVSSFFFIFFFFMTCCLIDAFKVPITGED